MINRFRDVSFSLYVKFCANARNRDQLVVANKQKFKIAVAATLDFSKVKSKGKIVSGRYFSSCNKFDANMCSRYGQ